MDDPRLANYLELITATNAGQRWYGGATLVGALRGVHREQALWIPPGLRNSIWRLVLHIAYRGYRARSMLSETGKRGEFRRPGADFPALPAHPDEQAWQDDVALLRDERRLLVQAIQGLDPQRLDEVPPSGERWTYSQIVEGVIHHDIHHTAQIQVLRRLKRVD